MSGLGHGYLKYCLFARKSDLKAKIYEIQVEIPGAHHLPRKIQRKYSHLHANPATGGDAREHPYYTKLRTEWNSCIMNTKDKIGEWFA